MRAEATSREHFWEAVDISGLQAPVHCGDCGRADGPAQSGGIFRSLASEFRLQKYCSDGKLPYRICFPGRCAGVPLPAEFKVEFGPKPPISPEDPGSKERTEVHPGRLPPGKKYSAKLFHLLPA